MKSVKHALIVVASITALHGCSTTKEPKTEPPQKTDTTQPDTTRPSVVKPTLNLTTSKSRIVEGDSILISWRVSNADKSATANLDGATVALTGSSVKYPANFAQTYRLNVLINEQIYSDSVIVYVEPRPRTVYTSADTSLGPDDGRFTIGCRGQRLTYGYPAPLSTSHIIVKVNGELATNNPRFYYTNNIKRISGQSKRAGRLGYNRTEIPLRFYGVDIFQRVVPVDRSFREIEDEGNAVYYKVQWVLTNRQAEQVKVGLSYLLDTMIDDNDAAKIMADETRVSFEQRFVGGDVPASCSVFRRDFNPNDLTGLFIVDPKNTVKPKELIVGRWPYLHGLTWPDCVPGAPYFDSAIMTTWDDIELEPDSTVQFAVYYGTKQGYPIIMLDNNESMKSDVKMFYYELSESRLNQQTIEQLKEMAKGRRILAASVSGFSDAQGDITTNLTVSRDRAERVVKQLMSQGVPRETIMVKAYGESNALQTPEARKAGNPTDRRVEVNIWYEE